MGAQPELPMKRLREFTSAATYCPHFKKLRGSFAPYDKIENYAIKGPVIKLQREEGASFGMVTILAPVEGRTRKVTLALSEPLPEGNDGSSSAPLRSSCGNARARAANIQVGKS